MNTIHLDVVPAAPPERPTVFVVVTARAVVGWNVINGVRQEVYGGDVGGILMHADGSVGWEHMSSNLDWLRHDVTTNFPDRRAQLEARYGDTLDIAIIGDWAAAPEWLRERNAAWATSQTPNSTEQEEIASGA